MAPPRISQTSILTTFDHLVSTSKIIHDTDQTPIPYSVSSPYSFHTLFIITSAFQQKPSQPSDSTAANEQEQEDLLPGSDISIAGFEIADVGERHVLAFNKFPSFRPHLLLLTRDGWVRQKEDLDGRDLGAMWDVLGGLGGGDGEGGDGEGEGEEKSEWVGIFNCGKEGGCSRVHKHMQIFPLPASRDRDRWTLFPTCDEQSVDSKDVRVPFRYFMRRFEGGVDAGEAEAYKAYVEMLGKTREVLGIAQDQYCPHNVVMTREWMVVIPRRKGQVEGLGVNAASMMGLVTVKDRGEYERWKSVGVERLLEEAGVAR